MTEGDVTFSFEGGAEAGPPDSLTVLQSPFSRRRPPDLAALAAARVVPALIERRRPPGLDADLPDAAMVLTFASLLFDGTGSDCENFAFDLLARTGDPQLVAARLLDPAAAEIGLRWCADTGDFLRVTYAVSRLQRLFRCLVEECPPPLADRQRKLALLGPVPGEQHTFGLSIVEDALRRAGWEVDLCLPGEEGEMLRLVEANRYCFVGLSLGGEQLLPTLKRTAERLRRRSLNPNIRVVAGGWLFREQPLLALQAGADHCCADANAAVRLAQSLLAPMPARCQMPVAAE